MRMCSLTPARNVPTCESNMRICAGQRRKVLEALHGVISGDLLLRIATSSGLSSAFGMSTTDVQPALTVSI